MHQKKLEFETKLKAFFDRHDPSKKDLAHRIASQFVNHQDEVFEHLSDLFHKKEGIEVTETAIFSTSFGSGAEPF